MLTSVMPSDENHTHDINETKDIHETKQHPSEYIYQKHSSPTVVWEHEHDHTSTKATSTTTSTGTIITTTTSTPTSTETTITQIIRPRDAPRTPWRWTHDMDPGAYLSTQGLDGECTEIMDGLFLGARSNAANKRELDRKRITCILNCCVESPNFWQHEGIIYHNLPVIDTHDQNITQELKIGSDWIWERRREGKAVLVHCVAGISRSASIVLAYLMTYHSHTLYSAFVYIKSRRRCIHPNPGFLRQLSAYEIQLRHKTTLPLVYAALCSPKDIQTFEAERRRNFKKCVIQ